MVNLINGLTKFRSTYVKLFNRTEKQVNNDLDITINTKSYKKPKPYP